MCTERCPHTLLGKHVEVVLAGGPVLVTGKLLTVCEDGEFTILHEDGTVHWCWPLLEIREIP